MDTPEGKHPYIRNLRPAQARNGTRCVVSHSPCEAFRFLIPRARREERVSTLTTRCVHEVSLTLSLAYALLHLEAENSNPSVTATGSQMHSRNTRTPPKGQFSERMPE